MQAPTHPILKAIQMLVVIILATERGDTRHQLKMLKWED